MLSVPLVIAHRGVHNTGLTENTIDAYCAALDAGADMIELDVRRTGAGELAVLHDHLIGKVRLDSCSLDDFEAQTGFRPPLLAEVLGWASGRIGLDIELKEDGYVDELVPLLQDFASGSSDLLVTSFLDSVLHQLHERTPELQLGLLMSWTADRFEQRALACGAETILPEMKLVNEALVAGAADAGLDIVVWDFMAATHGGWLDDGRIRGFITDDVVGALSTLHL